MHEARSDRLTAALVFFAVLAVYLLWTAEVHHGDGLFFANSIENAEGLSSSLLHPSSLLYQPLGYLAYRITRWFADVRALSVLQYANCLLAAGAVAIFHRILRSVIGPGWLAVCLAMLFAFSAAWWRTAVDANAFIPSIFLLLIIFYLLLPGKYERPVSVAILHTLTICLHYLAVFFFPVAIAGIFMQTRGLPPGERRLQALKYAATVTILTLGSYITAFYVQVGETDVNGFLAWITSGATGDNFNFAANLRRSITGEVKLFVDGSLRHVQGDLTPFTIFLLVVLAALVCGLVYELLIKPRRRLPVRYRATPRRPGVAGLCGLWIVVYLAFLFVWTSGATEFRLFYLPALIILLGIWLSDRRWLAVAKRPVTLLVAIVAISNLILHIDPNTRVEAEGPETVTPATPPAQPAADEKTPEPR